MSLTLVGSYLKDHECQLLLFSFGEMYIENICDFAATHGQTRLFKWGLRMGYIPGPYAIILAAKANNLEIAEMARFSGVTLHNFVYTCAIIRNNVRMFKWAYEHFCTSFKPDLSKDLLPEMPVLTKINWLKSARFIKESATIYDHKEIKLQCVYLENHPMDLAIIFNRVELFRIMYNWEKIDRPRIELIGKYGRLEIIKLLNKGEDISLAVKHAFVCGHNHLLKWIFDNLLDWQAETTRRSLLIGAIQTRNLEIIEAIEPDLRTSLHYGFKKQGGIDFLRWCRSRIDQGTMNLIIRNSIKCGDIDVVKELLNFIDDDAARLALRKLQFDIFEMILQKLGTRGNVVDYLQPDLDVRAFEYIHKKHPDKTIFEIALRSRDNCVIRWAVSQGAVPSYAAKLVLISYGCEETAAAEYAVQTPERKKHIMAVATAAGIRPDIFTRDTKKYL